MEVHEPGVEMRKKILAGINMNEKELEESVVMFREWLKKQPHLPKSADDITIKAFIIGCKSLERAKAKFDAYYQVRVLYPVPLFQDRDPCHIKWVNGQTAVVLPNLTPDGCYVVMFTMPPKESVCDFEGDMCFKMVLMFYDLLFRRHYMSAGVYALADVSNISLELTMKIPLALMSTFTKIYQEGFPMRLKAFVAFNAPPLADTFFNSFVKPFFTKKLRDRMYVNSGDYKCVEKYVPLEMLPSDYGGKNESMKTIFEAEKKYLISNRDWFLKEGSETSMEDFRPKDTKDEMKGTYRKLQIE